MAGDHPAPQRPDPASPGTDDAQERVNWRMPPLALLKPVDWSPGHQAGHGAGRRLPRDLRHPASRQGRPARGRVILLMTAAHLPHYTSTDAITGTVIFAVLLIIVAVAALRRR